MRDFKKLKVWGKSFSLALELYKITKLFPESEKFGLVDQIRRASVSISSNIAEGSNRNSPKEFIRYLSISSGSISEVESLLLLSKELGYISLESMNNILDLIIEVRKMINGLRLSILN